MRSTITRAFFILFSMVFVTNLVTCSGTFAGPFLLRVSDLVAFDVLYDIVTSLCPAPLPISL